MESIDDQLSVLRQSRLVPAAFGLGALAVGTGIGFAAPTVATWLVDLLHHSPLPVPQLLEVLAGLPLTWSVPAGVLLGLVGAAFLTSAIVHEGLELTVADDHLEYRQEGREGWLDRAEVRHIYADGTDAVVLDDQSRVLVRLNAEALPAGKLAHTLHQHGFPWCEQDPFEADYQRWLAGRPGFSSPEHRLIGQWQEVRRKTPERMSAEAELREVGVVVRYRNGRVQVRRTGE